MSVQYKEWPLEGANKQDLCMLVQYKEWPLVGCSEQLLCLTLVFSWGHLGPHLFFKESDFESCFSPVLVLFGPRFTPVLVHIFLVLVLIFS